jgi:6-phospho-3-hexuloisomerase
MSGFHDRTKQVTEEIQDTLNCVDEVQVEALAQAIMAAYHVFVAGKGRTGLQMRAFAMRLMHLGVPVYIVDEATTPGIAAGDLLLVGSGSGRTASLIQYAKRARHLSARLVLLTADTESEIAMLADQVLEIPAPTPKSQRLQERSSVQPMGSLFEQTLGILLDVLILRLMEIKQIDAGQMFARHANLE